MATSIYSSSPSVATPPGVFRRSAAFHRSADPAIAYRQNWVVRKHRVRPALAGLVIELAGLGPRS